MSSDFSEWTFIGQCLGHHIEFCLHSVSETLVHPDSQLHYVHNMDQANQLFTPPQSPVILRDIRTMDCELEVERRWIRAELFMNQAAGATGVQQDNPLPLPQPVHQQQAQVPEQIANPPNPVIMNEYNSFNLANVTPPVAPKWKIMNSFWMGIASYNILAGWSLMDPWWYDINMLCNVSKSFVLLYVTFELLGLSYQRSIKPGETINTFYNRILKICNQYEFSDPDEILIDAIIFETSIVKA